MQQVEQGKKFSERVFPLREAGFDRVSPGQRMEEFPALPLSCHLVGGVTVPALSAMPLS